MTFHPCQPAIDVLIEREGERRRKRGSGMDGLTSTYLKGCATASRTSWCPMHSPA